MEPNYFTKITKSKIFLFTALLFIVLSFIFHFTSKVSKALNPKKDTSFAIVFLTEKPLIIEISSDKNTLYMPKRSSKFKKNATYKQKAKKVLEDAELGETNFAFISPKETDRQTVWQNLKTSMLYKRYNPTILAKNLYNFTILKFNKRTNLSWHDFALITIRKATLHPSDFIVKQDATQKDLETNINKPLLIEVFNASGKKNMAVNLTKYLRKLNDDNIIRLDVLRYSNYHKEEKHTKIISHTGRTEDLRELSKNLNLTNTEIFHKNAGSVNSDAKIIIGKDFELPKN
ncbi:MAG: LytR C-terminal domain-containing protein [Elusimicrobiaceae bacterium]|jgi:hypothetical protein|nr:LytR C-terminal domain-containing protein [Elusimicrobiaceae bacterium]MBT3954743.1 LytR C-terminal domain-containing protein [Elusimicrobiaceae bacterium]MBT4403055.1 LytR C-terminal domain-containing protein [Elusimicrobiaceae bacterium]MBT4439371.1 LytR C-terminal domain-containing protein [Elusimicrobiaceae bacterium]MBT5987493.1 LytR C-terminal domain-containing protein [Elusimicrobiaceae bacterium]